MLRKRKVNEWMPPDKNFWIVRKTLNLTAPHVVDRLARKNYYYIYSLIWKLYSSFSWHHSQVVESRHACLGVERHFTSIAWSCTKTKFYGNHVWTTETKLRNKLYGVGVIGSFVIGIIQNEGQLSSWLLSWHLNRLENSYFV